MKKMELCNLENNFLIKIRDMELEKQKKGTNIIIIYRFIISSYFF
jgi:hypothetical protein